MGLYLNRSRATLRSQLGTLKALEEAGRELSKDWFDAATDDPDEAEYLHALHQTQVRSARNGDDD